MSEKTITIPLEQWEQIQKEEEVLEVLKRNIYINQGECIEFYWDRDKNINTKDNMHDYLVVKEWLEK